MAPARTRRREGLVLVVTAICVVALIGAGVSSYGDPDLAGRAALARVSGEVANGVVAEWEQLRREPDLLAGPLTTWSTSPAPAPTPAAELERGPGNVVVEALLAEARRLDLEEEDPARALDVVLDVFEKEPDDARRAEARLRAIQLAVRCERHDVAIEQWELAQRELTGLEALDGTSALLLCALAAAPALPLEQRAMARDRLAARWIEGGLALPAATFEGDPLRAAYRRRVHELVADAEPDPRLAEFVLRERASALERIMGHPVPPPSDGGFAVLAVGERELVYRARDPQTVQGRFEPAGTVAGRIEAAARRAGQLDGGFAVAFGAVNAEAGPIVRERVSLPFGPEGIVLRHANPDSIVSEVGERQALLRAALFVLAAGVAAAGFSVFRALRRERHLADLKSTFVANVSHELRTPVSSILLMAENLQDGRVADPETRKRYHGLIRREAERLRRLVDDVLDFSRIERGKGVHLSPTELDVPGFAGELEAEARERVTDAGGQLAFTCNGVPPSLVADADALRRAVMNLVDNALKHSGASDIELELAGDGSDDTGDTGDTGGLVIRVRDRGRGISAARLETLFRPFERLEARDGSAGTGLGLAIVREIAEGHGGSARAIRPADGPGVTFELCLPREKP